MRKRYYLALILFPVDGFLKRAQEKEQIRGKPHQVSKTWGCLLLKQCWYEASASISVPAAEPQQTSLPFSKCLVHRILPVPNTYDSSAAQSLIAATVSEPGNRRPGSDPKVTIMLRCNSCQQPAL